MNQILLIAFTWISLVSWAQPQGNEWIAYDKVHVKVKVYQDAIYRVSYTTLQQAGLPVQTIDPSAFKLYAREKEWPLWVQGGNDGSFDFGDYLEFFGEKNNGWLDSLMYADPSDMGNPYYSLMNDTIHYFITWDDENDGKRFQLEDDQDFQAYDEPDYLLRTLRQVYSDNYNSGTLLSFDNRNTEYVEGEGWMSTRFGKGAGSLERAVLLPSTDAYTGPGSPSATGRTVFASANSPQPITAQGNHHIRIFRGETNNVQLADLYLTGYQLETVPFTFSGGQVTTTTRISHVVIDDLGLPVDQFRIAFVEMAYAHSKTLSNVGLYTLRLEANPADDRYHLDLETPELNQPILYALGGENYRLSPQLVDGQLDVIVPNQSNGSRTQLIVSDESQVILVNEVERVGENGFFTDFSALQPDSAFVIVTHSSLKNPALTYATYRTNSSRDAVLADVDELYDQFGGGIPKHPHGIRRFLAHIIEEWESPPAHLFLLGKSVYSDVEGNVVGSRRNPIHYSQSLVPSYGAPGSDLLFSTGLGWAGELVPAISTGRLSAESPQEVLDYLAKVVFNESRDPAAWMKNILHFGGGNTISEQTAFASFLSNYETIIEDTCFGGSVSTFLKESSLPIVFNLSDSISDIISEGISILTFFGHAGGGQFDQSIDEPANLEWGAHPMVIVNSCYSGDIHQLGQLSTSEDYVILPEKGAIGFLATIKQGLPGYLNTYSTELYRQIGFKHYGKSIGQQITETLEVLSELWEDIPDGRNSILMNLLQGDPSTIIFSPEKPDITLASSSISFYPEEITAFVDSFIVEVALTNIGKTTTSPFTVIVERTFPDGGTQNYSQTQNGLLFRDTLRFTIPTDFSSAFGLNTIEVSADLPSNSIPEIDNFFNNKATRTLLITDGAVSPILPYEFAIVPEIEVTLKASTGNPFATEREYVFQMDTTDLFVSPILQEFHITQEGGVLEWMPALLTTDSLVYYWRVAEEAVSPEEREWRESSFQYISERTGWGQAHYFQFKANRFNNMVYDRPERDIDFFSGLKSIKCDVTGNSTEAEYFIDFESQDYAGCTLTEAFHVAVIDPITLIPWETRYNGQNPENFFGNANDNGSCRPRTESYFIFRQNNLDQMNGFRNMVQNEVPDGHIILIYTWQHTRPDYWPTFLPDFSDIFSGLGANTIPNVTEQVPFILIGVKGQPETMVEAVGDTATTVISAEYFAQVFGNTGVMTSPLIGPAAGWESLYWAYDELGPTDSVRVKVFSIDEQGLQSSDAVIDEYITDSQPVNLGDVLSGSEFPFIRLQAYFQDEVELDPAQIDRWQVLYEPVPEAAINPALAYEFYADSLQEGEMIRLSTVIQNISALDMDSLLVSYWVEKADNSRMDIPYPRQDSLRAGEQLLDTLVFSTLGLQGQNNLWVEVNPRIVSTGLYDQAEQTHVNNLGRLSFRVSTDKLNPILDVTFDGQHILDGDLVSAEPMITVQLDDENPFLLMDDPADTVFFSLFLTEPNGFQRQLRFRSGQGEEVMRFIPADGKNNIAKIEMSPELLQNGIYRLLVIASDKSGNASGDVDYRISFKAERESTITEVMNYPNPFSTSTRFVFTLTGIRVPEYIKIEILTVTGKVVREIFKEELGPIRIGRNITDYAWDGRDEYGDPLANGIYLYRVIVKDAGQDVELRQTAASTFFKKGFGKMYLMR